MIDCCGFYLEELNRLNAKKRRKVINDSLNINLRKCRSI